MAKSQVPSRHGALVGTRNGARCAFPLGSVTTKIRYSGITFRGREGGLGLAEYAELSGRLNISALLSATAIRPHAPFVDVLGDFC